MSISDKKLNVGLNLSSELKLLVNNEQFSDVSFSVGEKEELIYGHKMVLAISSPVMKQMFYGNLAEKDYPIRILDLSSNGFINMLRYMYGFEIDFDFSILYDVYIAADKYLVYNLTDKIIEYIKIKLKVSNCCLIYDQLTKIIQITEIKKVEDILDHVKNLIMNKTEGAFSSDFFKQISKECLIDILNMEFLTMNEINLLRSCLNWIEAELIRKNLQSTFENKRSIFNEIKQFINFSKINIQQLTDFKEINTLLDDQEIGRLFLHLADKQKPIPFECKSLRKLYKNFFVVAASKAIELKQEISEKSILLNANQEIVITHIDTEFKDSVKNLVLNIYNEKNELLDVKNKKILSKNYWDFILDNFKIVPDVDYKITFKFDLHYIDAFNGVFKFETVDDDKKIVINLNSDSNCIYGIDFFTIN